MSRLCEELCRSDDALEKLRKRVEIVEDAINMKDKIQLEKEADYLARTVMALASAYQHPCPHDDCQYKENSPANIDIDSICCTCWREVARKAVKDASNNS